MNNIIGKCLGENIRAEDVSYDSATGIYSIRVGNRAVKITKDALQAENIKTLQEALSNVDNDNIKMDMLGTWAKARNKPIHYDRDETSDGLYRKIYLGDYGPRATGEAKTTAETAAEAEDEMMARLAAESSGSAGPAGAPFDSQSFDPLRARVEAAWTDSGAWKIDGLGAGVRPADTGDWSVRYADEAAEKLRADGVYGSGLGTAGRASAPWEDPLAADIANARNTIACIDMPELKPYYDPNAAPRVYYHDRFPSIPVRAIIDDAIELLNKNKGLHITKISFSQSHPDFNLAISSRIPERPGYIKTLEVAINHKAFDRAYKTELDGYAGLKARLDTNTYIKLRVAFLLYRALKLRDEDARKIKG